METASNARIGLPYVYSSKIRAIPLPSSPIPWSSETSPEIRITVHKPANTPVIRQMSSITVLTIPRESNIAGWHVKSLLVVQISHTHKESVATTWLEGIAEYGTGKGENEAIIDLVGSLGEYRDALERRKRKLGDSARKELECLRRLIERSPKRLRS